MSDFSFPEVVDKVVMGMKAREEVEMNIAAAVEAGKVPLAIWSERIACMA